jgi:membrane protein
LEENDVLGQAAQLSFYFLLALFPALLFLTTLFGYFAQSDELRDNLLEYFRQVAPHSALQVVRDTIQEISACFKRDGGNHRGPEQGVWRKG